MTMVSTNEIQATSSPKTSNGIGSPILSGLAKLADLIAKRSNQKIDRQAFDTMLTLEDHILKDIGITRDDVYWASKLPLSRNAAVELDQIARQRRISKPI